MKAQKLVASAAAAVIISAGTTRAATIVGVTDDNTAISFDSSDPIGLVTAKPISGLAVNEVVRGIDFRPTTGDLYALGSFGNVYTIDTTTVGAATAALQFNVNDDADLIADGGLSGSAFGVDFNPQADAAGANSMRIVSNTRQNLAVNVDTGDVLVATDVSYGGPPTPNIVGESYSNSVLGGTTAANPTVQYAIDSGTNNLVLQDFNAGTLTVVGPLGFDVNANVGFDIFAAGLNNNTGFAALDPDGDNVSNFYSIDLSSGAATDLGEINGGLLVPNIAAVQVPEPTAMLLAAISIALTMLRRRTR